MPQIAQMEFTGTAAVVAELAGALSVSDVAGVAF
jgi:hypothetical protein